MPTVKFFAGLRLFHSISALLILILLPPVTAAAAITSLVASKVVIYPFAAGWQGSH